MGSDGYSQLARSEPLVNFRGLARTTLKVSQDVASPGTAFSEDQPRAAHALLNHQPVLYVVQPAGVAEPVAQLAPWALLPPFSSVVSRHGWWICGGTGADRLRSGGRRRSASHCLNGVVARRLHMSGMDCLELLKDQHAEAKQLFKQLEKAEASKAHQLWTELKTKLTMHEELEETHLYPELKKEKAAEEIVLEAYQEHHVMDVLIQEISGLKPDEEEFHPKITVLQENVEHHIEEEEGELFPKVRKFWDRAKREDVGHKMADMKERLTRQRRAA